MLFFHRLKSTLLVELGSEHGETFARLGIELAKLLLEEIVRRPQLHVGSAYVPMILFHHFYRFLFGCAVHERLPEHFLGEICVFFGKKFGGMGKSSYICSVKMSLDARLGLQFLGITHLGSFCIC